MQKSLLSIACITYNHEKYIRECLDGFLRQKTDFSYEILIHDDASTDGTANIIREYEKMHPHIIKPIYQTENQYSKGIKLMNVRFNYPRAQGKYIAVCEGDDYWIDSCKLQKQVDFLEANPDYVITYHDYLSINEYADTRRESPLSITDKKDCTGEDLMVARIWVKPLTMCFRNVIKDFPEEIKKVKNGDTFLLSLIGNHGKGKWMGDEIEPGIYREHAGGVWSSIDNFQKNIDLVTTYYWICQYYSRIGNTKIAKLWFKGLLKYINKIEHLTFDSKENTFNLYEKQKKELLMIKNSKPYRLGRIITAPIRYLKSICKLR